MGCCIVPFQLHYMVGDRKAGGGGVSLAWCRQDSLADSSVQRVSIPHLGAAMDATAKHLVGIFLKDWGIAQK